MKKIRILFYIMLLTITKITADEYLYPVDTIEHEGKEKLCVLHQKGDRLELWYWNPVTKQATKALLSSFTPAGLTVLPEKKGFSFIDHDRVRVKQVNKRSTKSIDFYGPYDLARIHWIDEKNFYFGAKERHHSNLFHATIDGDLYRLTVSNSHDYIYPQKVDEDFFFIERSDEYGYSIMRTPYPTQKLNYLIDHDQHNVDLQTSLKNILNDSELPSYTPLLELENAKRIITTGSKTIAFLKMQTNERGFFIEHPEEADIKEETMNFVYHMFYKENNHWKTKRLFEFDLPLHLLVVKRGKVRLYESILPLLPYYDNDIIYFVSISQKTALLDVFAYHLVQGDIKQKTFSNRNGQNYFTPRLAGSSFFCGGSVLYEPRNFLPPYLDVDESGTEFFSFLEMTRETQ